MKAALSAVVVAVALAIAAAYVLDDRMQLTSAEAYTTSGVRVGDPGENLVEWR